MNVQMKSGTVFTIVLFGLIISALVTFSTAPVSAALGNVTNVTRNGDTLTISISSDQLIVQVCKPELLKVDYLPGGRLQFRHRGDREHHLERGGGDH